LVQQKTQGEMTGTAAVTCIVLAGGLGTRLRGTVGDVPKCLAPVGVQTFLDIQLRTLFAAGVAEVVLSLGHLSEQVIAAVQRSHPGAPVRWVVEPAPLGTGGAVAHVLDTLGLSEVLVANGDTYLDGDLSPMFVPLRVAAGELFRMALVNVPDRTRFGGVQAAGGRVQRFLEKGQQGPGAINAGLYRLARAALPASPSGPFSLEVDVLPALVSAGSVSAVELGGSFTDIGVPDDYRRFCAEQGGVAGLALGGVERVKRSGEHGV
jgi:D-glycero-alpha-D-manno-heptose 1-phosphate guanylyltransferase